MVRDFSATTTASASCGAALRPSGTPIICTVRMPARTQHAGEVGRAGEVVGDAAEQQRSLLRFSGSSMPGKILITARVVLAAVPGGWRPA